MVDRRSGTHMLCSFEVRQGKEKALRLPEGETPRCRILSSSLPRLRVGADTMFVSVVPADGGSEGGDVTGGGHDAGGNYFVSTLYARLAFGPPPSCQNGIPGLNFPRGAYQASLT